jgi:hypothetical protein
MVQAIDELIVEVKQTYHSWGTATLPWFRGEPESETPLLPKLYRNPTGHSSENIIVQRFRSLGPAYGSGLPVPTPEHNDHWLYVMQHVGVPTRLLDWTEGLLQATFFALNGSGGNAIVWMMDPCQLNNLSEIYFADPNEFPISWGNEHSPAVKNIQAAFQSDSMGMSYPICFIPTYIHPRMAVQRSTFTVHGKKKIGISSVEGLTHLSKFVLNGDRKESLLEDLRLLGMSYRSLFPDFDGLGRDVFP